MRNSKNNFSREHIGSRVKEIRGGLTYKEFADKLGVSAGFVNGIEKGVKKPSTEMLFSMVNIFSVDINWLLTGEGETQKTGLKTPEQEHLTLETQLIINLMNELPVGKQRKILNFALQCKAEPGESPPKNGQAVSGKTGSGGL